ncbi:hypothetical protein GCM10009641_61840 [Mycobacterium cookii]|uniref:Uncharacterized protein n=1 Tax=Nocardioides furvisabuli TaxID=375542 RepID=A0ABP5J0Z8_9ACTN|nr:hypothetical protein [Nocardioides furvisabuli]
MPNQDEDPSTYTQTEVWEVATDYGVLLLAVDKDGIRVTVRGAVPGQRALRDEPDREVDWNATDLDDIHIVGNKDGLRVTLRDGGRAESVARDQSDDDADSTRTLFAETYEAGWDEGRQAGWKEADEIFGRITDRFEKAVRDSHDTNHHGPAGWCDDGQCGSLLRAIADARVLMDER